MPIYMIIPRYSHNYAQFCQLLNNNLFTHCKILMLLTTPYRVGCEDLFVLWRCEGLARSLLLDWYLGSQKLREILTLLCCITLSSSRENQRSAQEVARRISGVVAGESMQKSTYQVPITNPYLPHYIICHLPLVFLSPTSPLPFYSPSLSQSPPLFSTCLFLFACVLDYLLPWRKIIPNCVISRIPIIMISLVLRLLLLIMMSVVKSIPLCWILLWKINSPAFLVNMSLLI